MTMTKVTPELAEKWLAQNPKNRTIKKAIVERYARDMTDGNWLYTGEAIKFSADGKLLDGQHRLTAILESTETIEMEVITDIPVEAQDFMDVGLKRTAADMLTINGYSYAVMTAAAARIALGVEEGLVEPGNYKATHGEIKTWVELNPTITDSAEMAKNYHRRLDVSPALVCYTHYMMSKIDRDAADAFWAQAASKIGLTEGEPILAMINKFADIRRQSQRIRAGVYISMIYRTWNAKRAGRTMSQMKIHSNVTGERARTPELL